MAKENVARITGLDAIAYAEAHGLTLSKYADPVEDARDGLSVEKALEVAREDASLIYCDVPTKRRPPAKKTFARHFGGMFLAGKAAALYSVEGQPGFLVQIESGSGRVFGFKRLTHDELDALPGANVASRLASLIELVTDDRISFGDTAEVSQ